MSLFPTTLSSRLPSVTLDLLGWPPQVFLRGLLPRRRRRPCGWGRAGPFGETSSGAVAAGAVGFGAAVTALERLGSCGGDVCEASHSCWSCSRSSSLRRWSFSTLRRLLRRRRAARAPQPAAQKTRAQATAPGPAFWANSRHGDLVLSSPGAGRTAAATQEAASAMSAIPCAGPVHGVYGDVTSAVTHLKCGLDRVPSFRK
mmetsp:Transcript_7305/g.21038  ORF Transcript_7305/g.21038 Transcript_7305/m.21038 type:complete len:201 (-) Transcript_7305:844-1446(-)